MAEYIKGFETIREPDGLLETGAVVTTHTHNFHHNTDFTMGLWEIHRFQPIVGKDGAQMVGGNSNEPMWTELPIERLRGGGPHHTIEIPKNMAHRFVLLEGPGFYRCRFINRDRNGNPVEEWQGHKKESR
jgi:hypothetical protein